MLTFLGYCHWPWCCLVCELHRKFHKFRIIWCDRQDAVATQSAYPSNTRVLIFLYPTNLLFEKVFFTHFFCLPFLLPFLLVVIHFYRLTASFLISSTLHKQFFLRFNSFLRRHQKSTIIFYQIADNLVFLLVHTAIMIHSETSKKSRGKTFRRWSTNYWN